MSYSKWKFYNSWIENNCSALVHTTEAELIYNNNVVDAVLYNFTTAAIRCGQLWDSQGRNIDYRQSTFQATIVDINKINQFRLDASSQVLSKIDEYFEYRCEIKLDK